MIGFAHDGFGDSDTVRVLLALDVNVLHIICRTEFLERCNPPIDAEAGITFRQLKEYLKPGKVYVGPLASGTRQLAKTVFGQHRLDLEKHATHGINNWHEVRAALNNGSIDVAFFCGRFDSEIIRKIAADGNCVLVGLGADRDVICQGNSHIYEYSIKPYAYGSHEFAPDSVTTIATRRVVICPQSMPKDTAYFIATQIYAAMRDVMPEADWNYPQPGFVGANALTYRLHPGAESFKQGVPPSTSPWSAKILLGTVALWICAELIGWLNKRATQLESPASPSTESQADRATYSTLKSELEGYVREVERKAIPLPKKDLTEWTQKTNDLRARIVAACERNELSEEDSHVLFAGLRELMLEIEIHGKRPVARDSVPSRTGSEGTLGTESQAT